MPSSAGSTEEYTRRLPSPSGWEEPASGANRRDFRRAVLDHDRHGSASRQFEFDAHGFPSRRVEHESSLVKQVALGAAGARDREYAAGVLRDDEALGRSPSQHVL